MSTAPIKAPNPKCRVCGLSSPDLIEEKAPPGAADAAERLGARQFSEYHCPDPERCRRVLRGQPLSDDRRFGNPVKWDPDQLPEPPPPNYQGDKPPPKDDDHTNGVS